MKFPHSKKDGSGQERGRGHGSCRDFGASCGHGFGRQERLRRCEAMQTKGSFPLTDLPEGKRARIVVNPDEQTVGMGLFSGQIIKMYKNDDEDKLVVCVGESRLVIPKKTAKSIVVR